jgi:ATP-dependent Lon protease
MSSTFISTNRTRLPVVPLRDMVVFPHMMAPFIIGREYSVKALERSLLETEKTIFLVAQLDPKVDEPAREDMYDMGVVAQVVQNLRLPNGNVKVMVEGLHRARLIELEEETGTLFAEVEAYEIKFPTDEKV